MARKDRKTRKRLGHRLHGRGNVKKGRGGGSKGGKGMGGAKGCKKIWILKNIGADYFGRHGFASIYDEKIEEKNIGELAEKARKENSKELVFEGKVLGGGVIDFPLNLSAISITAKAKGKLEKAGGKFSAINVYGEGKNKRIKPATPKEEKPKTKPQEEKPKTK